jgi:hypothetical protein
MCVIGLAIVVTLGVRGVLDLSVVGIGGGGDNSGYRNITLTDAQLECEKEARKEFGQRLRMITVDSHSSRYDQKINRYKMFFSLDVYPKRGKNKDIAVPYFLNCYVHGSRGSVTHFESMEDKEATPQPQRKPEGNIFGF